MRLQKPRISMEDLQELLDYDPMTGIFTWKRRGIKWFATESRCKSWNSQYSEERAGSVFDAKGGNRIIPKYYRRISLLKKNHTEHRLAFVYMGQGNLLDGLQVDHINHDGTDNRFANLRAVTSAVNQMNRSIASNNTSGQHGVSWHIRKKKWIAQIQVNKEMKFLGYFSKFEDAVEVRVAAEKEYGFHANHGNLGVDKERKCQ